MAEDTGFSDGYEQGSRDTAIEVVSKISHHIDSLISDLDQEIKIAEEKIKLLTQQRVSIESEFSPS